MRAVQIAQYGGPDVVTVRDIAEPVAGPGEVLVRVAAAGVNPVDWKIREGHMREFMPLSLPVTLGTELAGRVEALGEGVAGFAVGDEVHGLTARTGAFADLAILSAAAVARKPASMGMIEAAALPTAAATAAAALEAGNVGRGTRILIHAAAGGVGSIALQVARARGAEVTALASPGNVEFLRGLGANHVVDRTASYENTIGDFDVVLDAYGPEVHARSWPLLRKGGILISLTAPPSIEQAAEYGVRSAMVIAMPGGSILAATDKLVDSGQVKVTIARTYAVEDASAALAEVQGGRVRGKIVLRF